MLATLFNCSWNSPRFFVWNFAHLKVARNSRNQIGKTYGMVINLIENKCSEFDSYEPNKCAVLLSCIVKVKLWNTAFKDFM